ncbi:hypothetical protein BDZ94DRAFT_1267341 [Collybia nuda]|uniref:INO80 complex subunit B-like conserved region domain-containing protein n=1 Tax=Collybia nuda TaxID=64659 RepID=A0A9P5Y1R0_9AGAR|nr:hypothetical protein BDZ94DRAFT_1267341 [Collybia nuda]
MPVTTRTRRLTRKSRIDLQIDSDVEMDEPEPQPTPEEEEGANVDVEAVGEAEGDDEENDVEEEDEDEPEEEEDEEEDQIESDADDAQPASNLSPSRSRLKIKLKMPAQRETPVIESEDSDSESLPSTSTRPMTTRQAVLASVLDSTHVSLGGSRQKKKPLNESELALRREETARKRKNLSEKKLEDEKAETINRLLKKQSRPRNKRNTAQRTNDMDDVPLPLSLAGTRTNSNSNSTHNSVGRKRGKKIVRAVDNEEQDDGDDDEAMECVDEEDGEALEPEVRTPTMYRWVSSVKMKEGGEPTMAITFSVPVSAMPPQPQSLPLESTDVNARLPAPKICAAPGCGKPMRYRVVKDWAKGACGITCLKVVETSIAAAG